MSDLTYKAAVTDERGVKVGECDVTIRTDTVPAQMIQKFPDLPPGRYNVERIVAEPEPEYTKTLVDPLHAAERAIEALGPPPYLSFSGLAEAVKELAHGLASLAREVNGDG